MPVEAGGPVTPHGASDGRGDAVDAAGGAEQQRGAGDAGASPCSDADGAPVEVACGHRVAGGDTQVEDLSP